MKCTRLAVVRRCEKVCRKRVKEVAGADLAEKLKDVRARLVAVDDYHGRGGAKCSRHDLYEATMALHGEEMANEQARRGKGKVVGIQRELEDGTEVKIGEDENTTSIVLDNGYVMPEEYFQARGGVQFSRCIRWLARLSRRLTAA